MKIGFAGTIEMADSLAEAGYDFIEPLIAGFEMIDAASLEAAKQRVSEAWLPALSFGHFFTPDVRLVGPEIDASSVKSYLGLVAELMSHANADVAVMGSAAARNVPDGFERTKAEDQLLEAYSWAAETFHGSGATIAIEPQNRNETNIINSLPEAVSFAERVNRPERRVAADSYHMDEEDEPLQHLSTFAEWIVHVQLATSPSRFRASPPFPSCGTATSSFRGFGMDGSAAALRRAGANRLSSRPGTREKQAGCAPPWCIPSSATRKCRHLTSTVGSGRPRSLTA